MNYAIGIDPGADTGLAVYSVKDRALVSCRTLDFWATFKLVTAEYSPVGCALLIEDCSLNKLVFRQKGSGHYQDRLARNVGGVQRESELLIKGFELEGYKVLAIRPTQSKWSDAEFLRATGWTGRVSQHARDAARLCWGISKVS